jgi:hypothetical protein
VPDFPTRTPARPACHRCGAPAEHQHQRHATQAEYDRIDEDHRPINGRMTIAVDSCGDHAVEPFCVHTAAEPQPCPACHAPIGEPCVKPDGTRRPVEHPGRISEPAYDSCRHAHREDCGGYGACHCAAEDPEPVRTPRVPPTVNVQAALQANHEAEIAWLADLRRRYGPDGVNRAARDEYGAFMAQQRAARTVADTPTDTAH